MDQPDRLQLSENGRLLLDFHHKVIRERHYLTLEEIIGFFVDHPCSQLDLYLVNIALDGQKEQ